MRRGRSRGAKPASGGPRVTLRIDRLGNGGDGVATHEGAPVFVPLTLPGEAWEAELGPPAAGGRRAVPLTRLDGPPRAEPVCRHFTVCGGCTLQHLPAGQYVAFKSDRVRDALRRLPAPPLEDLARSPLASRRRVRLAFRRTARGGVLGYREKRSRTIVDVQECPIALPSLTALLDPLRALLAGLRALDAESEIRLSQAATGVDLCLIGFDASSLADREALAAFAEAHDLARITIAPGEDHPPEAVVTRRPPLVRFGEQAVELPPLGFMQATAAGEAALQAAVAGHVPDGASLVDLFAGLGTLTLPLLPRLARLHLVEADPEAHAATQRLRAVAQGRLTGHRRDLARDPLGPGELARFDAVVLDPPRAGAAAQVEALAEAAPSRIVYASCHPGSFARDAARLLQAGFTMTSLRPVDQFLFAAEVELVATFVR